MNLIIYNNYSGKKNNYKKFIELKDKLMKLSMVSTFETKKKLDALNYIKKMNITPKVIFIMGGDGTVHEVINGMVLNKNENIFESKICHVPIGSGNGIASSLNIKNIDDAISSYKKGNFKNIDLTKIESSEKTIYCVINILVGLVSDIDLKSEWLRCLGSLRFSLYAIPMILQNKNYKIEFNEEKLNIKTLILSNFKNLTTSDIIDSNAHPDDSELNLFMVNGNMSICELLKIFTNGFEIKSKKIIRDTIKSFSLKYEGGLNIDGEYYPELKNVKCEVIPNVVKFLYKNKIF